MIEYILQNEISREQEKNNDEVGRLLKSGETAPVCNVAMWELDIYVLFLQKKLLNRIQESFTSTPQSTGTVKSTNWYIIFLKLVLFF